MIKCYMLGRSVLIILIVISSLPVLIVYVWYRRAKFNYSIFWFLSALLLGAAAFFPALVFQTFLNFPFITGGRAGLFYHVFIRIAFTEEFSRLLMLFIFFGINNLIASKSRLAAENELVNQTGYDSEISWNTLRTGAAAGLVAGLGFAILENAVYEASYAGILWLRLVTAAPLHAACGSRVGMAAVMFRKNPVGALGRFISAVAIHGIYNFMIVLPGIASIAAVLVAFTSLASSVISINSKK